MKFDRTVPPKKYKNYSQYRDYTRQVFKRFCAYCFRHEIEAGGEGAYEQDHFRPKSHGKRFGSDYRNLYWSCRECNSARNKDGHWPSREQVLKGMGFSDSVDHDPIGTDYTITNGEAMPINAVGDYTVTHIRLNRESLRETRRERERVYAAYHALYLEIKRVESILSMSPIREFAAELKRRIRLFLDQEPFIFCNQPDLAGLDTVLVATSTRKS